MVDAENEFAREQLRLRGLLQDHIASFARRDGNVDNSTRVVSASDGVVPRYIRIRRMASEGNNVGANKNHEEEEHTVREAVLAAGGRRVPWCPPYASESFYALPPEFRIAQWPLYQQGKIYGMDVASGVAVWALGPRPGDNVLDLCCCPGLKLCMVAEQMHHTGTITGVDISRGRLSVCRQVLVKYQIGRAAGVLVSPCSSPSASRSPSPGAPLWCRLLCADGCCFETEWDAAWAGREEDVVFDSRAYDWQGMEARGQKRMNRGTRRRESLALRRVLNPAENGAGREGRRERANEEGGGYDRVLVDADCSHDGSTRHMLKVAGLDDSIRMRSGGFLSEEKLGGLEELQRGLLRNAFRRLRPGGVLVYSTCSLSPRQNEDVVAHLLKEEADAILDPILELGLPLFSCEMEEKGEGGKRSDDNAQANESLHACGRGYLPCRWGSLPGTLLFEPRFGETSGLFIARIKKKQLNTFD